MESITYFVKIFKFEILKSSSSIWFWISIIEFISILIILIISSRKKFKNSKFKSEKDMIMKEDIDFNNIINSSFNSKELYDELIRKCHPDKFVQNVDNYKIALSISQEITKNKNDIKLLKELKEEAIKQLNITFKI